MAEQGAKQAEVSLVVVARSGGPRSLTLLLRTLFESSWVSSYMIGFGPPLVRSSERIIQRVREARSALEKLGAYIDVCLIDEPERRRLNDLHRRLMVRSRGPVEAESLDESSADVLDLSLRLHHPALAPPAVAREMRSAGVPLDVVPMKSPPEALTARVLVRLADPRGARLLELPAVRELAPDPEDALAVELRVPPPVREMFGMFLAALESYAYIDLGDPTAHARVTRN